MIEQVFSDLKLAQKLLLDSAIAELNGAQAGNAKSGSENSLGLQNNDSGSRTEGNKVTNEYQDGLGLNLQHKLDVSGMIVQ
jgi:hypothetical protein